MISAASRESLQPKRAACGAWASASSLAALDVLTRMLRLAGDEALVAAHHLPPDLGGRAARRSRLELRGDGCRERRELRVAGRAGEHDGRLPSTVVTSA